MEAYFRSETNPMWAFTVRRLNQIPHDEHAKQTRQSDLLQYQVTIYPPGTSTFCERVLYLESPSLIRKAVEQYVQLRESGMTKQKAKELTKTKAEELYEYDSPKNTTNHQEK